MVKVTFACNYNFATDTEEIAVTEIAVPGKNVDDAINRLIAILGNTRCEKLKDRIYFQDCREYE